MDDLINYLNDGANDKYISKKLNISCLELYKKIQLLEQQGIYFHKRYYYDGTITYHKLDEIYDEEYNLNRVIYRVIIPKNINEIKYVIISDMHFGNSKENIDSIKKVMEYCKDNDIHIVFSCGDQIDGTFSSAKQKIKHTEQIDYFLENFPFDDNIIVFSVTGDHDKSLKTKYDLSFSNEVSKVRHNFVATRNNTMTIPIFKDKILLFHDDTELKTLEHHGENIIYKGHLHKNFLKSFGTGLLSVNVGCLSNLSMTGPVFIEATADIKNEHINNISHKFFSVSNDEIKLLFKKQDNLYSRFMTFEEKLNEDLIGNSKIKKINQIEKFNKKYGKK